MDGTDHDLLVVGGGPAGAATAYWAATHGLDVAFVERKAFPRDKTCGDGLTPRAVHQLEEMGLGGTLEGYHRFDGLRAIAHGRTLEMAWPDHDSFPRYGYVVRRCDLDAFVADHAVAAGATHVVGLVDSVLEGAVGPVSVSTDVGVIAADRVLLATGAFSRYGRSPAAGLDLEYALHTQLLVHLDAAEVDRLAGMSSIIGKHADPADDFYLTPPVPDPVAGGAGREARWILKIGSPQDDHVRATADELAAWFRTDGDPAFAARLLRILERLLPGLRDRGRWTTSCVTTYTPSGHPYIDWLDGPSGRVAGAIGGNGYAAKCAPALGELAAGMLLSGPSDRDWPTEVDRDLFRARWLP